MKYLWHTTSKIFGDVELTHHTLLPRNTDTDMNTYMRYIEFSFFCLMNAFICNVTVEFICASYTYGNQKKILGLDIQRLCNQRMVMKKFLIFLFIGEDSSECGVRCGSWYHRSTCIVQRAAVWMDTNFTWKLYLVYTPFCITIYS